MKPSFSVIIPVLNEERRIGACIENIRVLSPRAQIIVVDGLSRDKTAEIAQNLGVLVCSSDPGRGTQSNQGAKRAKGEILVFLHVDTKLPEGSFDFLKERFADPKLQIGTFRMRFDRDHWFLGLCGFMTQFDSVWTRFGDQCIVVRKSFFEEISGFPDWPLFEDVEFLRRARRKTSIGSFPLQVVTSARRFEKNGILRQQMFNGLLLMQFLTGADVGKLAERYRKLGTKE
jgi:rSAM/selenodomain-associated transferase 2